MVRTVLEVILFGFALIFPFIAGSLTPGEKRVDYLLETLKNHSDYKVRMAAASELGKVADGTVADWMIQSFRKEENPAVRLSILYSIGHIPDERILPPMLELATQEFLAGDEQLAIERVVWNFRRAVVSNAWGQSLLQSKEREVRALSAYLLGLVSDTTAVPVLVVGLHDPIANVRM